MKKLQLTPHKIYAYIWTNTNDKHSTNDLLRPKISDFPVAQTLHKHVNEPKITTQLETKTQVLL
ncbi:hypothetical protein [Pontimicrobium aquaticum]|uniref:Uncharacterized protein n=1 Tax=Pontimicrobium aquaticum TaxID=2565367 RepID=A0A4U0F182_9FLAO|nr:hypothetical protein [Pontimicrobium aquaticum]TJY36382.1 hypothetical protein E5167_06885 [Pontimicrobium aquaticum]